MTVRQSKILGGLLAAAVGDAMGAATEIRTTGMIKSGSAAMSPTLCSRPRTPGPTGPRRAW